MHRDRLALLSAAVLAALATQALAQKPFVGARSYPLSSLAQWKALGDFDGDADADLVELSSAGSFSTGFANFRPWTNPGDGEVAAGAQSSLMAPVGGWAAQAGALLADFDGDGDDDLVVDVRDVFGSAGTDLRIFPGGPGGLASSSLLETGAAYIGGMVAADLEGDGASEIAVLQNPPGFATTEVRWYHVTQAGLVSSAPLVVANNSISELRVADYTGDGVPDLAVFEGLDRIQLLPTVNGTPTLGAELLVPSALVNINHDLMIGDVDVDGDLDLVVFTWVTTSPGDDHHLTTWKNLGNGSFAAPIDDPNVSPPPFAGFAVQDMRMADWDGDGDPDITNQTYSLKVMENDGTGVFTWASEIYTADGYTGAGPGDLDADGLLDFVAPRAIVFGTGGFENVLSFTDTVSYPSVSNFDDVFDWEGDGDVDLFALDSHAYWPNDGTGHCGDQFTGISTPLLFPDPPGNESFGTPVAFGDLNGDGLADYLSPRTKFISLFNTEFLGMALLVDDGGGHFVDAGLVSGPNVQLTIPVGSTWRTADLEGDGIGEVLVLDGYHALVAGQLTAKVPAWSGEPLGSRDMDGDLDVDVFTLLNGSLILNLNLGGLAFAPSTLVNGLAGGVTLLHADLDDDGDLDLAVSSNAGNDLHLFEASGGTLLAPVAIDGPSSGTTAMGLAVQDVDGDGQSDLVNVRNLLDGAFFSNSSVAVVHLRIGPGLTYAAAREWLARDAKTVADLDGDGDLDAFGGYVLRGGIHAPPEGGKIRQYGAGSAGTGGAVPLLGAAGPVAPGSTSATLTLRRGLGGSVGVLAIGTGEFYLPGLPFYDTTLYVAGVVALAAIPLTGPLAGVGDGRFDIPIDVDNGLVGLTFFHQVFVYDPAAASLFTATNGLEIAYGF